MADSPSLVQTTTAWYASKTFWFNIITALLAVFAIPEVSTIIPPEFLKYIATFNMIGNIILRLFGTNTPVTSDGRALAVQDGKGNNIEVTPATAAKVEAGAVIKI